MAIRNLIIILGDQLSEEISSLQNFDKNQDEILMMEVLNEATYVKHHKKKLVFVFSCMRHFAENLKNNGYKISYYHFNEHNNKSFTECISAFLKNNSPQKLIITEPGEYRVLEEISYFEKQFNIPLELLKDNRFFCSTEEFKEWANGKNSLRMEYFYREMRKKHNILLDFKNNPEGGKWNYDEENRNKYDYKEEVKQLITFKQDKITKQVIKLIEEKFPNHFGNIEPFNYPVTEKDAKLALEDFIKNRLKNFGKYQDSMQESEPFLFHSILSPYINIGLLNPKFICQRIEAEYRKGKIPLNSAEGFIRQILGWREFIRGIYWHKMPMYKELNYFKFKNKLPEFYWNSETEMNCVKQAVQGTINHAYSHHIQRLMVTGNLALLLGVNPDYVDDWYLLVYMDAYEWVQLPNTRGMSQFADGGYLASKPYISSGKYINKMSNFCENCKYNVEESETENACPFNYLYWNFFIQNEEKLKNNKRLAYSFATFRKFSEEKKRKIAKLAKAFINKLKIEH